MTGSALRARLRGGAAVVSVAAAMWSAGGFAQQIELPTGGQVVGGSAVIGLPSGNHLTVDQASARAVIDWTSFSIGAGGTVQFNNGTGATLNRVLGGDPSSIAGQLRATGSVFLINPAGIVVDSSGKVLVGGSFVASTKGLGSDAFMAGGNLSFTGSSVAGISNLGEIAAGGDAVLIGHIASNSGTIAAGGTAGLATGTTVVLREASGDGRIFVEGASGDATNSGSITAASAELRAAGGNVYALAGSTGVVRATGSETKGGRIWLTAGKDITVESGAVLDASAANATASGGTIEIIATKGLNFAGTALADAGASEGDGGLIETSAHGGALVLGGLIRAASSFGKAGLWVIDPFDLIIDAGNVGTLTTALATQNVTLLTTDTGASATGTVDNDLGAGFAGTDQGNGNGGDIFINAAVSWSAATSLTINAFRSVEVNAAITNSNGTVNINAGQGVATGTITQTAAITAATLTVSSDDGDISLGGQNNNVISFAANTTGGNVSFRETNGFSIAASSLGTGDLTLISNTGTISQSAAISGDILTVTTPGGGAISLGSQNNNFATVSLDTRFDGDNSGTISYRDDNGFALNGARTLGTGGGSAANVVVLSSTGTVSQGAGAGNVITATALMLTGNGGAFTLDNSGNTISGNISGTTGSLTLANDVATTLSNLVLTGALSVTTSNDTLSQGGGTTLSAGAVSASTGSGSVTLANNNTVTSYAATVSGAATVSLRDDGGFDIGTGGIQTGGGAITLTVAGAGGITQGSNTIIGNSALTINKVTGTITLDAANVINTLTVVGGTSGGVSFRDNGGFAVAGLTNGSGDVSLTSATGNITQTGVITAGALTTTTTSGTVDLSTQNNVLTSVGFSSTNAAASFRDDGGFAVGVGGGNLGSGALTLITDSGAITQANNDGFVAGAVSLTSGGGNISLGASGNNFASLTATLGSGTLEIRNGSNTSVTGITGSGDVTLRQATGTLSQSGAINIGTAVLSVIASSAVTSLGTQNNTVGDFNVSGAPGNITFRDDGGFRVTGISDNGSNAVTLISGSGNITQNAAINAGTLTVTTTAGGNIALGTSDNTVTTVVLDTRFDGNTGGTISFRDDNGFTLNGARTLGAGGTANAVTLSSTGTVSQGAGAGNVTTATTLTVTGSGGAFTLDNAANTISGNVATSGTSGSLTLANDVATTLATIALTGALSVTTSNDALSQSGVTTLTAGAVSASTGSGSVTFANNNTVTSYAATVTGSATVSLRDDGGFSIGTGGISTGGGAITLTVAGAGGISQGANTIIGNSALTINKVTGTIALDAANVISSLTVAGGTNGAVTFRDNGGFTIDSITNGSGAVTLNSDSGSIVGGAITAGALVVSAGSTVELLGANAVSSFAATTTDADVSFVNDGSFALNATSLGSGDLTLTSATGNITTGGALTADIVSVNKTTGNVTLNNAGNAVTTFSASISGGGDASFRDDGGFNINATIGSGTLTAQTAGGAIVSNGVVTAGTVSASSTSGAITFDNSNNAIGTFAATSSSGGAITVRDDGGLVLGTTSTSGTLTVATAAAALTQSGGVTAGTLTISNAGAVNLATQTNAISALSTTSVGSLALSTSSALSTGAVTATSGGIALTTTGANSLTVGNTLTPSGNNAITLSAGNNLVLTGALAGGSSSAISLTAGTTTAGGTITQASAITGGALTATSTNGAITLTHASNAITSFAATSNQGNVSFVNNGGFVLAASNLDADSSGGTGDLTLDPTNGNITQSGALTADDVTIATTTGSVSLNNSGNSFNTIAAPTVGALTLVNTKSLTLAAITASNGGISITTTGSNVDLTVGGALTPSGNNGITLSAGRHLAINAALAGGASSPISLTSGTTTTSGTITQSAAITGGALSATSGGGAITLTNSSNSASTFAASSSGGAIQLTLGDSTGTLTLAGSGVLAGSGNVTISTSGRGLADTVSAGITGGTLTVSTSTGNIVLDNGSNTNVATFNATNSGSASVSIRDNNGVAISGISAGSGGVTLTTNLTTGGGGTGITQSGAITTAGLLTANAGGNTIDLRRTDNAVGSFRASGSTSSALVQFRDNTGYAVGQSIMTGGSLELYSTTGAITQTGAGITAENLVVETTAGNVSLDSFASAVATFKATTTGGNVSFDTSTGFALQTSNLSAGRLTIGSTGTVTQGGVLTAGALRLVGPGTFTFTQTNAVGVFSSAITSSGSANFKTGQDLVLGETTGPLSTGATTLTLDVTGSVTQASGASVNIGDFSVTTSGGGSKFVTLDSTANSFGSIAASTSGGNASFYSAGSGTLTLNTLNTGSGSLQVLAPAQAIAQGGGTAITAGATTFGTVGRAVTLINSGNNVSSVNISTAETSNAGGAISFRDDTGFTIDDAASGVGFRTLGAGGTAASVTLISNGTVGGATNGITATSLTLGGTGTFTLTSANNDVASLNGAAGSIALTNASDLLIGTLSTGSGALTLVTTNDAVSQSGAITAGALSVTTAGGAITLANTSNAVTSASLDTRRSGAQGGAISFGEANGYTLNGALTNFGNGGASANSVALTLASGTLAQGAGAGNVIQSTTLTLSGAGAFNLNNTLNAVGRLQTSGGATGAITLFNDFTLALGNIDVGSNTLSLTTSNDNIAQDFFNGSSGTDTTIVAGTLATNTGNGSVQIAGTDIDATTPNPTNNINNIDVTTTGANATVVVGAGSGTITVQSAQLGSGNLFVATGTPRAIAQTGAIGASALEVHSSGGSITLTSASNSVSSIILDAESGGTTGGAVSFRASGGYRIDKINTRGTTGAMNSNTVSLQAGGAVTLFDNGGSNDGYVDATTLTLTSSGTGFNLAIGTGQNRIDTLVATTANGNVSLRNGSALALGTSNLGSGTLTLSNGANAISQTGAVTAGTVNATTSNAAVNLGTQTNSIGTFGASTSGGNASLTNNAALTVATTNTGGGTLTLSNGSAAIGQSGAITAATLGLGSSTGAVTLNSANSVGTLSGGGTLSSLAFTNSGSLTTGALTSSGAVALTVSGVSVLTIGNTLDGSSVALTGSSVAINGAVTATGSGGTITVTADGATLTGGSLTANTGAASITLRPLTATRGITLGGSVMGTLELSSGLLGAITTPSLIIGSGMTGLINIASSLSLQTGGSQTLTLQSGVSSGNAITEGAVSLTTRDLTVTTAGGHVALNGAANAVSRFGGTTSNGDVSLDNGATNLVITGLNAGTGTVALGGTGTVTQTGAITAANLNVGGAGTYTLTGATNLVGSLAGSGASAISLLNGRALTLGQAAVATLSATTITVTNGAFAITSGNSVTATTLDVTTSNAAIDLAVDVGGGNIPVDHHLANFKASTGGGNLRLLSTGQTLNLTGINSGAGTATFFTDSALTQSTAPITASTLSISTGGAVNLGLANQVGSLAFLFDPASLSFTNAASLSVGAFSTGGNVSITTSGGSANLTLAGALTHSGTGAATIDLTAGGALNLNANIGGGSGALTTNLFASNGSATFSGAAVTSNNGNITTSATGTINFASGAGTGLFSGTGTNLLRGNSMNLSNGDMTGGFKSVTGTNVELRPLLAARDTQIAGTDGGGVLFLSATDIGRVNATNLTLASVNGSLTIAGAVTAQTGGSQTLVLSSGKASGTAIGVSGAGAVTTRSLSLISGGGDIQLGANANDADLLLASGGGGNVSFLDSDEIDLAGVTASALTIETSSGAITDSAAVAVGTLNATTNNAAVTLDHASTQIGTLSAASNGGAITIIDSQGGLVIGSGNILAGAGAVSLTTVTDILNNGNFLTAGNLTLSAGNVIGLSSTSNTITGTVAATGASFSLGNDVATTLGAINTGSGGLTVTTTNDAVTQTGAGLTAGALAVTTGGGAITLNTAGNNVASINLDTSRGGNTGGAIQITDTNGFDVVGIVTRNGGDTGAAVTLNAAGITDTSGVAQIRATVMTLNAGAGSIALGSSNNHQITRLVATGTAGTASVNFRANAGFDIGASNLNGGTLTVSANTGGFTQSGAISAGSLIVNAGSAVVLDSFSNAVAAFRATTSNDDVSLNNGTTSVAIGATNLGTGRLSLGTTGTGTQTAAITAGALFLTGGAFNFTSFTNSVGKVSAGIGASSVSLKNGSALVLGDSGNSTGLAVSGAASVETTAGAITQEGAVTASSLTATGVGGITLASASNDVDTVSLATTNAAASFTDADGIAVASIATGTGAITLNSTGAAITQTGAITGGVLALNSAGAVTLADSGNNVTGVTSTGLTSLTLEDTGGLQIGNLSATGTVNIRTTGALTTAASSTLSAGATGEAVVLATSGTFAAGASSAITTASGRFLIFLTDPSKLTIANAPTGKTMYGIARGGNLNITPTVSPTGSRYVFANTPSAKFQPTARTVAYNGANQTATGFDAAIRQGTVNVDYSSLDDASEVASLTGATFGGGRRNAGTGTGVTTITAGTFSSAIGYSDGGFLTGNITITPRALTIDATAIGAKTYDGTTTAAGTPTVTSGSLVGGDTFTSLTQAYVSKNALGNNGSTVTPVAVINDTNGGNNYAVTLNTVMATIDKKDVTISTVTASNKVYDGTFAATLNGGTSSGFIMGDDVNISAGTGTFVSKDVGTGITVNISGFTLGGTDAPNYNVVGAPSSTTANITARPITVTGVTVGSGRVYDGTNSATALLGGSPVVATGVMGETFAINAAGAAATFSQVNVGTNLAVTLTGYALGAAGGGAMASNYSLSQQTGLTANITTRPITVTAATGSKVYDRLLTSAGTPTITSGSMASGETLTGVTQVYASANVLGMNGSTLNVVTTGASVTGGQALLSNYAVTTASAMGTITAAPLTITGVTAANKVYNGNTAASLSGGTLNGVLSPDDVTFTAGSGTFATANQGTGIVVTATGFGITGAQSGNYALSGQPSGITANITVRSLTLTGVSAASRVYDGTTVAVLSGGTLNNVVMGDTVSFSAGTGAFASPNVGTVLPVTASGFALTNNPDGNYSLAGQPAGIIANINVRPVTLTAVTATKVYDATTSAAGTPTVAAAGMNTGLVSGETLGGITQVFASKDVLGNNASTINVVTTGATITGGQALASNYSFSTNTAMGTITPASLTVVAADKTRVYGGTDPALTIIVTGMAGGESAGTATTGSLVRVAGTGAGTYAINQGSVAATANYQIGTFTPGVFTISKAVLTATAPTLSRVYGDANPSLTVALTGFVSPDGVAAVDTAAAVSVLPTAATAAVQASNVGGYATTASGGTAANYSFAYVPGTLTVTAAPLAVTATAGTRVYGNADPVLAFDATGFKLSDTASVLTGALARAAGENVGSYAINAGTLAGGNYTIQTFTPANLTITAAPLTVAANAVSRVYGAADPALTVTVTGLKLADTAATALSGAQTRAAGVNAGTYAISQGTLTASSNYSLTYTGANFTITPATLTVTGSSATRVYGDANPALTATLSGFVAPTPNGTVDTAAVLTSLPTAATTATAASNAGSYAVTPSGGAGANYALTYVNGALTVTPAALTVAATNATKVYGTADPALGFTTTGLKLSDTAASVLTGALARAAGANVGSYAITQGTLVSNGNYAITYTPGLFAITPATLSFAVANSSATYGTLASVGPVTFTGLVQGDTVVGTTAVRTAAGQAVTLATNTGAATYTSTVTGLTGTSAGNYVLAATGNTNGQVLINRAALAATVGSSFRTVGQANPAIPLTLTGLVGGDTQAAIGQLVSVSGLPATDAAPGTYALGATAGAGLTNYTLTVTPGSLRVDPVPTQTVEVVTVPGTNGTAQGSLTTTVTSGTAASFVAPAPTTTTTGGGATGGTSGGGTTTQLASGSGFSVAVTTTPAATRTTSGGSTTGGGTATGGATTSGGTATGGTATGGGTTTGGTSTGGTATGGTATGGTTATGGGSTATGGTASGSGDSGTGGTPAAATGGTTATGGTGTSATGGGGQASDAAAPGADSGTPDLSGAGASSFGDDSGDSDDDNNSTDTTAQAPAGGQ